MRRLPNTPAERGRVISFVTRHVPVFEARPVNPVFIFWGRIHPQKGLDRALKIFAAVHIVHPMARFIIIGPDGGGLERIKRLANEIGVSAAVSFLGGMDFNGIVRQARFASFYLQTSLLEGMAMSVVEAMQLGLVPVVTPVGEIGNYARHGKNALIVQSDESVVNEILAVLSDNPKYIELRKNAAVTWDRAPLYTESVLLACTEILSMPSVNSGRLS